MSKFKALKDSKEFTQIYQNGRKWYCEQAVVYFLEDEIDKFGVVVSKKVGKAVIRNLVKRRIRAAFYNMHKDLKTGIYVIVAKTTINSSSFNELLKNLRWSFKKLGALR